MTTDNPSPKARFGNTNKLGKFKEGKLISYNVRIDPATIALIKQLQAEHGLKSQGEVITLAVRLLEKENNMSNISVGDIVLLDGSVGNHGCSSYALLRYEGNGKATVIEQSTCGWSGHGYNGDFMSLGESVTISKVKPLAFSRVGAKWETFGYN